MGLLRALNKIRGGYPGGWKRWRAIGAIARHRLSSRMILTIAAA
jgi:hypothetical protein